MSTSPRLASRLAILALATGAAGCGIQGSGRVIAEERPAATAFHSLSVAGQSTVTVTRGKGGITVTTDDNLVQYVRTTIVGDRLTVEERDAQGSVTLRPSHGINVEVVVPEDLVDLDVSGSGSLIMNGPLTATLPAQTMNVSGSGSIDAAVDTKSLTVDGSGSGSLHLTGKADAADLHVSGSGSVNAYSLSAAAVTVDLSGSGSVEITATATLDGELSGSGSVHYHGSPRVSVKKSGSGSVSGP